MLEIAIADVMVDEDLQRLIGEHLDDMRATSAPDSVHALDTDGLADDGVTVWTFREDGVLLGCGALKALDPLSGEMKSMRTTTDARRRGVGAAMLEQARERGYVTLSLETGTQDYFEPARRLYLRRGFVECEPFADYVLDPHSVFMTLRLSPSA